MTIEKAKQNVGKWVMSRDAGDKTIRCVAKAHGPYRLIKITKGGMAILEGRDEFRIPPNLLGPVVLFSIWTGNQWVSNNVNGLPDTVRVFDSPDMANQAIQDLQKQAILNGASIELAVVTVESQPEKHTHPDQIRIVGSIL